MSRYKKPATNARRRRGLCGLLTLESVVYGVYQPRCTPYTCQERGRHAPRTPWRRDRALAEAVALADAEGIDAVRWRPGGATSTWF